MLKCAGYLGEENYKTLVYRHNPPPDVQLQPPSGLRLAQLPTDLPFEKAIAECSKVWDDCEGVNSSRSQTSEYFFITNPFPLDYKGRPVFEISDSRLENLIQILQEVMRSFGTDPERMNSPLFNAIIRRYTKGQRIPPHIDRASKFQEEIYGVILKNTSKSSLRFTLGTKQYSIPEKQGCCLQLTGEARYRWLHEFNMTDPETVRISVTFRWYQSLDVGPALRSGY